ncbi:hypothetical protein TWF718_005726 [Orbilia javanica]|uniref:Uncharacterized protein n=1 Tax=Orbilia javanica TaxID=47235 RepID=A0AAN8REE4_9PEZI
MEPGPSRQRSALVLGNTMLDAVAEEITRAHPPTMPATREEEDTRILEIVDSQIERTFNERLESEVSRCLQTCNIRGSRGMTQDKNLGLDDNTPLSCPIDRNGNVVRINRELTKAQISRLTMGECNGILDSINIRQEGSLQLRRWKIRAFFVGVE